MSEPLLQVSHLNAGYGAGLVLEGISFAMAPGGSLAVLGRNGVGKSTLMLSLMGHVGLRPGGRIMFRGTDITAASPHRRVSLGLAWVPQEREVFPSLTVEEHLRIAARPGKWSAARVYELFPRLAERRRNLGAQLSGGEQQMLAIGRALTTNPALLLLDEPLEGLAPVIVKQVASCIRRLITEDDMSIILVEQHAKFALGLTRDAIVLDRGQIVHSGASEALLGDNLLLDRLVGVRRAGSDQAAVGAADTIRIKPRRQETSRAH